MASMLTFDDSKDDNLTLLTDVSRPVVFVSVGI